MDKLSRYCKEYGYNMDYDKEVIHKIFNNERLTKIHIDTYSDEPYILFLRSIENKVTLSNKENRIKVMKNDKKKTVILNIPIEKIDECVFKKVTDKQYEVIMMVLGICYKMLVII